MKTRRAVAERVRVGRPREIGTREAGTEAAESIARTTATDLPVLLPGAARLIAPPPPSVPPGRHLALAGRARVRAAGLFVSAAASPKRRPAPTSRRSLRRCGNGRRYSRAASCSISRSALSRWRSAPRSGCCSGFAPDFAAAPGQARRVAGDELLSQCAVAGAAVLLHVPAAVPDHRLRHDDSAARLGQGDAGPGAAGDGERCRNPARRDAVDPDRAVGIRRFARLQPAPDAVDDHPAAVRQAHAAAVDEPVRDPDDGDGACLDCRGQRDDDPDPPGALRREPARIAALVLRYVLLWFFVYCYPIARWTVRLEARYAVNV